MSQGPSSAPALEHVPSAPAFHSKHPCISPCLSSGQTAMLLCIRGCLSPLHLVRCQVWVMGSSALTRHCCLQSCWAQPKHRQGLRQFWAGDLFGTVPACYSHDPFLLAVPPRMLLQMSCLFLPYFMQSSAPWRPCLSCFPPPQVHFPPASRHSHAGHGGEALGPARPPQLWQRPDVSHGTVPRSTGPRRL